MREGPNEISLAAGINLRSSSAMFLVSQSLDSRAKDIREWLRINPSVAVVAAASYFEWIVCRTILGLSQRPNTEIREALGAVYGLDKYKAFWWKELQYLPDARRLPEVVSNWSAIVQSFQARNVLVHGRDRFTRNMASPKIESLLVGVADVSSYAAQCGMDINTRLRIRKRPARHG